MKKNLIGVGIFLTIIFISVFCKENREVVPLGPFESECSQASVEELASMLATTESDARIGGIGYYSPLAKRIAWQYLKQKVSVRDTNLLQRLLVYDGYAIEQDLFQEITGVYLAYLPNGVAKEEKRDYMLQTATSLYGGWKKFVEK